MLSSKTIFTQILRISVLLFIPVFIFGVMGCSDDDDGDDNGPSGPSGSSDYVFVIENGAQTIEMNNNGSTSVQAAASLTYSAYLVNSEGARVNAGSVGWTTSNNDVCTIEANGAVTVKSQGIVTVTATVTHDGEQYTATAPLRITIPEVFAVAPPAAILVTGETIMLTPVFFTDGAATYSYASSDPNIASVNANGEVAAAGAGLAEITVTATNKDNVEVIVPILVIGMPQAELPVTRVTVDPSGVDMFRNESVQLTAKAFKSDGAESFAWSSTDESIATVDANGMVTAHAIGETQIQAMAKGIAGHSMVTVYPDTMVIVTPFLAQVQQGSEFQFTAKAYNVRNEPITHLSGVTQFEWYMPSFGDFGEMFEMFDVGEIDQTGKVTVKPDAMIGLTSIVMARIPGKPETTGGAAVMVDLGINLP